jgi:hypothetical protein
MAIISTGKCRGPSGSDLLSLTGNRPYWPDGTSLFFVVTTGSGTGFCSVLGDFENFCFIRLKTMVYGYASCQSIKALLRSLAVYEPELTKVAAWVFSASATSTCRSPLVTG